MTNLIILQQTLNTIKEGLSDNAKVFIGDNDNLGYNYCISDLMHEYADNTTSIYYNEQFEYYINNVERCEDAITNYGYDLNALLKEKTLYQICCFAGQIGEYVDILGDLYSQSEDIIKALAINYCIENNIDVQLDYLYEKIENLDENSDLCDIMEAIEND